MTKRLAMDTFNPKTIQIETKTYSPKPAKPGATVSPKAPLAPAETGHNDPKPPPAKND